MEYLDWDEAVRTVSPYVVRVMTQDGSGTGFLVSNSTDGTMCAIATAAHVISSAHLWEQPIRLVHEKSGESVLLRAPDRAVLLKEANDTAAIMVRKGDLPLPAEELSLAPEGKHLTVGNEIGWLGYPAVASSELCFFGGRISAARRGGREPFEYLVDGVAINGVSGGPAFWNGGDEVTLMGVMSAYIANRATGETLPGLTVVSNVDQFHTVAKVIKDLDEAKDQESPPEDSANETGEPEP